MFRSRLPFLSSNTLLNRRGIIIGKLPVLGKKPLEAGFPNNTIFLTGVSAGRKEGRKYYCGGPNQAGFPNRIIHPPLQVQFVCVEVI
jgi:hypothetical protein